MKAKNDQLSEIDKVDVQIVRALNKEDGFIVVSDMTYDKRYAELILAETVLETL